MEIKFLVPSDAHKSKKKKGALKKEVSESGRKPFTTGGCTPIFQIRFMRGLRDFKD